MTSSSSSVARVHSMVVLVFALAGPPGCWPVVTDADVRKHTTPVPSLALRAAPASPSAIHLSWTLAPSAVIYTIYVAQDDGPFHALVSLPATCSEATPSGLTPNTHYIFHIAAVRQDGSTITAARIPIVTPADHPKDGG